MIHKKSPNGTSSNHQVCVGCFEEVFLYDKWQKLNETLNKRQVRFNRFRKVLFDKWQKLANPKIEHQITIRYDI